MDLHIGNTLLILETPSNDDSSEAFKSLEKDIHSWQKTGKWSCSICQKSPESLGKVTFEHKFQLVTHWHEKHSHKEAVYEVCQWCMELFFSPGSSAKVGYFCFIRAWQQYGTNYTLLLLYEFTLEYHILITYTITDNENGLLTK